MITGLKTSGLRIMKDSITMKLLQGIQKDNETNLQKVLLVKASKEKN